jgi:hypothetical protein
MKRATIKKLMRMNEVVPGPQDYSLGEIFDHSSFTEASSAERERIMPTSSELIHADEVENPFGRYFGAWLKAYLRGKTVLDLGCLAGGRAVA